MDERARDIDMPENIFYKQLRNLYSYQGIIPHEARNKISVFVHMVSTNKDGIKPL